MKILTEASGSLTAGYLLSAIKQSGHLAVASDIDSNCYAKLLADDFVLMPNSNSPNLWIEIELLLNEKEVTAVIPSLDETLLEWAKRKTKFKEQNIQVFISSENTVETFQDKWKTFNFFRKHGIPTPDTSLQQNHKLIKPRFGRGSVGVFTTTEVVSMEGNISQQYIEGTEYTIDVFCDKNGEPVYIVPRKRLNVKDGKSTAGVVIKHPEIERFVRLICNATCFVGPINIQCIETIDGDIKFIEINPRIAGGMALGFAATENWVKLLVDHFVYDKEIKPVDIKYGMKMMRYYSEVFMFE